MIAAIRGPYRIGTLTLRRLTGGDRPTAAATFDELMGDDPYSDRRDIKHLQTRRADLPGADQTRHTPPGSCRTISSAGADLPQPRPRMPGLPTRPAANALAQRLGRRLGQHVGAGRLRGVPGVQA